MGELVPPDPPLAGRQVALRPFRVSDAAAIAESGRDPDIPRFTMMPEAMTKDQARQRVERGLEWCLVVWLLCGDGAAVRRVRWSAVAPVSRLKPSGLWFEVRILGPLGVALTVADYGSELSANLNGHGMSWLPLAHPAAPGPYQT
jgi:hypothetical protein